MEIVVGTKKWSSWSMRPWLALKRTGAPFEETLIPLRQDGFSTEAIRARSPSGLAPALRDGDLLVWDSLAICEYLAERFPEARLWPADPADRALARAAAAEMHSGFSALRAECPMDLALRTKADLSEATRANVRRIVELWTGLLARTGGPFLLGDWTIADAFYTPVATRFRSYAIDLASDAAQAYSDRLLTTPEYLAWEAGA